MVHSTSWWFFSDASDDDDASYVAYLLQAFAAGDFRVFSGDEDDGNGGGRGATRGEREERREEAGESPEEDAAPVILVHGVFGKRVFTVCCIVASVVSSVDVLRTICWRCSCCSMCVCVDIICSGRKSSPFGMK